MKALLIAVIVDLRFVPFSKFQPKQKPPLSVLFISNGFEVCSPRQRAVYLDRQSRTYRKTDQRATRLCVNSCPFGSVCRYAMDVYRKRS